MKKNDIFKVTIEDMGENGEGIGKAAGFTWFIKDAVIGDVLEARAVKVNKSYGFARLEKLLTPSKSRVEPLCPVARSCGGCQLQALEYKEQLKYKERKIYNNLVRIGGFEEVPMLPIMGMEDPWRYRNKAQFPWGTDREGRIVTGFYAGRTHSIIEREDCLLGAEENQEILRAVKSYMEETGIRSYSESSHSGLMRHTLIRKGFWTGEIMVCLVVNGDRLPHEDKLVERLRKIPGVTSVVLNVNRTRTNVILGNRIRVLFGGDYITDRIGDVKYRISPLSFYQVNPIQTEKLYSEALNFAGLTGEETVWDLYCGIGTISLFLAQRAKQVYGVEIVPEAVADARVNARINGIENVEFFVGKAEEVLPGEFEKNHITADVIVVDPPRKGCDSACLETMVKMRPEKIVYISCDSATLARDLKFLTGRGYRLEKVRGCDMFGHTGHVETAVLLVRKP